jgi:hypothetical protein
VLILILALPPIIITIGTSFMEDRFLQAPSISEALRNENTRPPVVRRGTTVTVVVPLTLQSFFGYHLCRSIKLDRVVASLANGEEVPVTLTDVRCDDGGRKPGKTDVIPLMENVRLRLLFTLPDDPTLRGAVIGMVLSGDLWLIPQGSKEPTSTRHFDAEMHFRVARDEEADFQESYDTLSATLYRYNWLSFLTAGLVILAIIFLSPWVCIFCGGPVLGVKFKNVSVCRKCYDEREIE